MDIDSKELLRRLKEKAKTDRKSQTIYFSQSLYTELKEIANAEKTPIYLILEDLVTLFIADYRRHSK